MPLNTLLADAAKKGAELNPCHGKMYHDCAFKVQPDINGYTAAVEGAMTALLHPGNKMVFNCHTSDFKDAGRVCRGFLYAKQYFDYIDNIESDNKK